MKSLIVSLLACLCFSVSAGTIIETSGMSDAQVAALKAHAAQIVADAEKAKANPSTPAKVNEVMTIAASWGSQASAAAEGFARALNIAAKELGVTVNDFLHTDAGKIVAVLIVWKVAGAALIKMLYGTLFVTVGLSIARVLYLRIFTKETVQLPFSRFWGMWSGTKLVRVPKTFSDLDTEGEWLMVWVMLAVVLATIVFGGMFF